MDAGKRNLGKGRRGKRMESCNLSRLQAFYEKLYGRQAIELHLSLLSSNEVEERALKSKQAVQFQRDSLLGPNPCI